MYTRVLEQGSQRPIARRQITTGKERCTAISRTRTVAVPFRADPLAATPPLVLTLEVRGELIVSVSAPCEGICRRGVVSLAEHQSIARVLALVERSCAVAGYAHRLALCLAIEDVTKTVMVAPGRAHLVRVLFAEMERLLARLGLLGTMAQAIGAGRRYARALEEREALLDALEAATGARLFWGVAVPGGVRDELDLVPLGEALDDLAASLADWREATSPRSVIGRAGAGIGVVAAPRVEQLGIRGLIARAAGAGEDLRAVAAYSGYADLTQRWPAPIATSGDVAARAACAAQEMQTSAELMRDCLERLEHLDRRAAVGPLAATTYRSDMSVERFKRDGQATVDGPHGPVTVGVRLASMETVAHLVLEPPGGSLPSLLPELLVGRTLGEAPLVLASLDLCLECIDL